MDEDRSKKARDKIAKLVSTHGVAIPPEKKAVPETKGHTQRNASGGIQITAETLNLSNVSFHTGLDGKPVIMPEVKPVEKMDDEEKKAYQSGEWDGIERRDRDSIKEELLFKKYEAKRKQDTQDIVTYYTMLAILFFTIIAMVVLPVAHKIGAI